ncbi:MAG: hypothetical protein PHD82_17070, partial [Candidatus Riflebacteria bacterium]|nr:hypothetical protein [Candidatus Riflebacteria bacterium]
MPNSLFRKACLAALSLFLALPVSTSAEEYVDLTQFFARQTEALVDETESDAAAFAPQIPGLLAYADVRPRQTGDIETFSTFNVVKNAHEKIKARLAKIGQHCYIYVEQGRNVAQKDVDRIAGAFDKRIYDEARSMFGSEKSPGIDNDARVTLLLLDIKDFYNPSAGSKGFTAGYFNAG